MRLPRLSRLLGLLALGLILAGGVTAAVLEVRGRHQDEAARSSAEHATATYRKQFHIGESDANVESALTSLNFNTLHRGDDILIIAKEGRPLFYCSHNYLGTVLRFTQHSLSEIDSDEWADTCL